MQQYRRWAGRSCGVCDLEHLLCELLGELVLLGDLREGVVDGILGPLEHAQRELIAIHRQELELGPSESGVQLGIFDELNKEQHNKSR